MAAEPANSLAKFGYPELRQVIQTKEGVLLARSEELEDLRTRIDAVRVKFDQSVGYLYLELEALEVKIEATKRFLDLLAGYLDEEEARRQSDSEFREEFERIQFRRERLKSEATDKPTVELSEEDLAELKRLYRQLAHRWHPTLQGGDAVKMIAINAAYREHDLDALRSFAADVDREVVSGDESEQELRQRIEELDASLADVEAQMTQLRGGYWHLLLEEWETGKAEGRDVMQELAAKVAAKIEEKKAELAVLTGQNG